jgi:hypothetical protein
LSITLTSPAFTEGSAIPKRHAGEGDNLSPALRWSGFPAATKSFVLLVEDPDAPSGTFIHWVLVNIPCEVLELTEGLPEKSALPGLGQQGKNDARQTGYFGPYPPPGKPHRYYFKIFALDRELDLPAGCTALQVQNAMRDHILDTGFLMGTYQR